MVVHCKRHSPGEDAAYIMLSGSQQRNCIGFCGIRVYGVAWRFESGARINIVGQSIPRELPDEKLARRDIYRK